MDMFFVGLLVGLFVAWATTWFLIKALVSRIHTELSKILDAVLEKAENIDHKEIIMARVELHDDTFYVYNKENNEFMAQGRTLAELKEHMFKRYSRDKYNVIADPEDNEEVLKKLKETANETGHSI